MNEKLSHDMIDYMQAQKPKRIEHDLWNPIVFDDKWQECHIPTLQKTNEDSRLYDAYLWLCAIHTGLVENLYTLPDNSIKEIILDIPMRTWSALDSNIKNIISDQYDGMTLATAFAKDNTPISKHMMREIHALTTRSQEFATGINRYGQHVDIPLLHGQFKVRPNTVSKIIDNIVHVFKYCPPEQVESELDNFITLTNTIDLHPIVFAAFVHMCFVQIHPFQDGNGRTARLLTSKVLVENGYYPFNVMLKDKYLYFDAIEKADNGDFQAFVDFMAYAEQENLNYCKQVLEIE